MRILPRCHGTHPTASSTLYFSIPFLSLRRLPRKGFDIRKFN
nr:MAG TPA: hypothetical protein [Caudoviricetes sp.]